MTSDLCSRSRIRLIAVTAFTSMLLLGPRPALGARATIAWDPNKESTLAGYQLHYGTHAGPPYDGTFAVEGPSPIEIPLSKLGDPSKPEFKLTVPPCTVFYVNLKAYDNTGAYSDFAGEISAKVAVKPTGLKAVVEGNAILLTWDAPAPEDATALTQYLIYYDTDGPGEPYAGRGAAQGEAPISVPLKSLANLKAPQIRIPGLEIYRDVYFVIAAACSTGESNKSDEVLVHGTAQAGPDDPASPGTGCDCRISSGPEGGPVWLLLLGLGALLGRRRRASR